MPHECACPWNIDQLVHLQIKIFICKVGNDDLNHDIWKMPHECASPWNTEQLVHLQIKIFICTVGNDDLNHDIWKMPHECACPRNIRQKKCNRSHKPLTKFPHFAAWNFSNKTKQTQKLFVHLVNLFLNWPNLIFKFCQPSQCFCFTTLPKWSNYFIFRVQSKVFQGRYIIFFLVVVINGSPTGVE